MEKIRKRGRLATVVVAAGMGLAALAGCEADASINADQAATVTEHVHHPAYNTLIIVGKVPIMQHHPERFGLEIEQCGRDGERGADERGCLQDEIIVSEEVYDTYQDGSTIIPAEVQN